MDLQIPEELWSQHKVSYDRLRIFGCIAYAHIPKELRSKLEPKSRKCIFIGYGQEGEFGYHLYDPQSKAIIRSSDVVFNEARMHKQPVKEVEYRKVTFSDVDGVPQGGLIPTVTEAPIERPHDVEANTSLPRRSTRMSNPPERFVRGIYFVLLTDCGEPTCYKQAMQSEDSKKWDLAMKSEITSIVKNGTWDLVPLPQGKEALPCKWVFKRKVTSGDITPKYKARLVAKGFKAKVWDRF